MAKGRVIQLEVQVNPKGFKDQVSNLALLFNQAMTGTSPGGYAGIGATVGGAIGQQVHNVAQAFVAQAANPFMTDRARNAQLLQQAASAAPAAGAAVLGAAGAAVGSAIPGLGTAAGYAIGTAAGYAGGVAVDYFTKKAYAEESYVQGNLEQEATAMFTQLAEAGVDPNRPDLREGIDRILRARGALHQRAFDAVPRALAGFANTIGAVGRDKEGLWGG